MKARIIVENSTLSLLKAEWGLSIYLEEGECRILFDLGTTGLFLKNAAGLGIDLRKLDAIVLSHGHSDHTGGLAELIAFYQKEGIGREEAPTLIAHPDAFFPKMNLKGQENGMQLARETVAEYLALTVTKEPHWLTERLVFLGEIPRRHSFEMPERQGKMIRNGQEELDKLLDDSAVVYQSPEGLVIITGCSHSGICNIIDHAIAVCGDDRIVDVVGGLHLMQAPEEQVAGTVAYFEQVAPQRLHACHCTGVKALVGLGKIADLGDTGVGLPLKWE